MLGAVRFTPLFPSAARSRTRILLHTNEISDSFLMMMMMIVLDGQVHQ
jgi:hypothetical protein